MAAERWGPRYVVLISTLASAVFTFLSPVAARMNHVALIVTRFFLGFAGVRGNYIFIHTMQFLNVLAKRLMSYIVILAYM